MRRPLRLHITCALAIACACSKGPSHNPQPSAAPTAAPAATQADEPLPSVSLPALSARAVPELGALLTRRGVSGAVALLDGDAPTALCNDVARCSEALTPASTFKIPNSVIGLETGVIADADFVIPWDGVTRRMTAWNRDHTLRTAIRDSVVPYYQELARRVGPARMREWLERLQYGNAQMGDHVDEFWLKGPLAITPLQQLEFLRKLVRARLPISARTRDIVLHITRLGELDGKPLHGKTGWSDPDGPTETGWFVGWIDDAQSPRYVAVAVVRPPRGIDLMPMRREIAEEALRWRGSPSP
ncbi:MAG TPA: penicillin-binding transpeptidase domain-containing protein [Polyangiales bacterium]|nr:penicillin-binding transpeptidase domain-containing protein [Polyangiales bacterium]